MNALYWIFWPAFMVAVLATALLISAVDPQAIQLAGRAIRLSNIGAYSIGFLVLWTLAAASSLTTCILRREGKAINRKWLPVERRAGRPHEVRREIGR